MSKYEILCPLSEHPELAHFDDNGLHAWAEAFSVPLRRDWRGKLSTSLEDAYRVRGILDEAKVRAAELDNARLERLAAVDAAQKAPLQAKLDRAARRSAAHAAIDADELPLSDERWRDWESRADSKAAELFAPPAPPVEVDTRSPLERLLAKGGVS